MAIHALVEFHMLGLANFKYSMYCVILIPNIPFSCVCAIVHLVTVFLTVFMSTLTSAAISEYICPALKRLMILLLPLNNNKLLFT